MCSLVPGSHRQCDVQSIDIAGQIMNLLWCENEVDKIKRQLLLLDDKGKILLSVVPLLCTLSIRYIRVLTLIILVFVPVFVDPKPAPGDKPT